LECLPASDDAILPGKDRRDLRFHLVHAQSIAGSAHSAPGCPHPAVVINFAVR